MSPGNRHAPWRLDVPLHPFPPDALPADRLLINLPQLVSGDWLRAWGEAAEVPPVTVRPRCMHYKPENQASVLFDVTADGRDSWVVATLAPGRNLTKRASRSAGRTAARRARCRSLVPEPIVAVPGLDLLLEWHPARLVLPGLALDARRLRRWVGDESIPVAGPSAETEEPRLVVYRPGRRAVLRWAGLIIKVYATDRDHRQATDNLERSRAVRGVHGATPVASAASLRATAQLDLAADPLPATFDARTRLGESLRCLHRAPREDLLEVRPPPNSPRRARPPSTWPWSTRPWRLSSDTC